MKTLYLETYSGISGDMTVAALLDLGADEKVLRNGLASLGAGGYDLKIGKVKKCGITACDFNVILHNDNEHKQEHDYVKKHEHVNEHKNKNDHGHEHSHGPEHDHGCGHKHKHSNEPEHDHGCGHKHEHSHEYEHEHDQIHEHRGLKDILTMIEASDITDRAKGLAEKIFGIVAVAEGKVHGLPVDEVHFHEVGAIDSIVDIVGAAICLDNLGIDKVVCTPLREGSGTVWCQHGRVPVPAPATLEIAVAHKIPLVITQNDGEMVTPTGIAIVAAFGCSFDAPQALTVVKTGYGAGKKEFAVANVLRASIVELAADTVSGETDEVLELSCNLDDMTAEQTAYACEIFMAESALDFRLVPATMKKGRQGVTLSLLIRPCDEEKFTRLLFLHTSTIGVRIAELRRNKMMRRESSIKTRYGTLDVKECSYGEICKTTVEYESAKKLSEAAGKPISEIYLEAAKHLK